MRVFCIWLMSLLSISAALPAEDYKAPNFEIQHVDLTFHLDPEKTQVSSKMKIHNIDSSAQEPLVLHGENLSLVSVKMNGRLLTPDEYEVSSKDLTLLKPQENFELEIVNEINPAANTSLEGLYLSNGIFCTQNESEGFRKITYFLDRPDVMATYTTKIIADSNKYPVLLSNGNKIEEGFLEDGRHFAVWEDPYKKPSYLYALVAGDLDVIQNTYVRQSGKPVDLKIYCEKGLKNKCFYAMDCLKRAMKWDEERFGLECDLDTYMIVAINDFNAGAMENKGLNIFNASCILASSETSTDNNFKNIEGVIGHEYFHNWTGNRVTLRDWKELNVKEALTVFRDQEFSIDMNPGHPQRIQDVAVLKQYQFPEDSGPTAHAICPTGNIDTRNLYSATVYNKGPEVVRMLQTMLGRDTFKKGMETYFKLYDGQAVTTDQFLGAMETASGRDLSQFKRWYTQIGTPRLQISKRYDPEEHTLTVYTKQYNPREGSRALPLHFPLLVGLIDPNGNELNLDTNLLEINRKKHTFVFQNVMNPPVLSINRQFSAPIILEQEMSFAEYVTLMMHDSDDYNRWEAATSLSKQVMLSLVGDIQNHRKLALSKEYKEAFRNILTDPNLSPALKAEMLVLPTESELGQQQEIIDFDANHKARKWMKQTLAVAMQDILESTYNELNEKVPYSIEGEAMGKRALKNVCLSYLASIEQQPYNSLCYEQFRSATNMTDQLAALQCLNQIPCDERNWALAQFYDQWKEDALVVNKWFATEALTPLDGALDEVKALLDHPAFDIKEPNKSRALIMSFTQNNIHFNAPNGSGYTFIEEQIAKLDQINPHTASMLATAYRHYPKLDPARKKLMKKSMQNLLKHNLSATTAEIIKKTLASD